MRTTTMTRATSKSPMVYTMVYLLLTHRFGDPRRGHHEEAVIGIRFGYPISALDT